MSKKIENEAIKNRYELVDWIYKKVKKRLEPDFEQLEKQTDKFFEATVGVNDLINSMNYHKREIENQQKALNDRSNNLQLIYDKMINIEKQLKTFKELRDFFTNEKILEPLTWEEIPAHKIKIEQSELVVRTKNCLELMGVKTFGDLVKLKKQDLLKSNNLGKKSLNEIVNELARHGLKLSG